MAKLTVFCPWMLVRMFVSPWGACCWKNRCSLGLRMSQSMSRVRAPVWAKVAARFAEVVDLPSPGEELETWMTLGATSALEKRMLVRRPR